MRRLAIVASFLVGLLLAHSLMHLALIGVGQEIVVLHKRTGADPNVHRLLRQKHGLADRLVRLWVGTDTEPGLITRSTCKGVPVRLERL